jgi:hypothetical protein
MSFFSSPASQPIKQAPPEDPEQTAARKAILQDADSSQAAVADRARQRYLGRTMGTAGANALYTDTAAGFSRTMGSANV